MDQRLTPCLLVVIGCELWSQRLVRSIWPWRMTRFSYSLGDLHHGFGFVGVKVVSGVAAGAMTAGSGWIRAGAVRVCKDQLELPRVMYTFTMERLISEFRQLYPQPTVV
jgi:hypothetical protein